MSDFFDFDQRQKTLNDSFAPNQTLTDIHRNQNKIRFYAVGLTVCASIVGIILTKRVIDFKTVIPK